MSANGLHTVESDPELAALVAAAKQLRVEGYGIRRDPRALAIPPVSALAPLPPPPPRDSICEPLALHAGRVATMLANGGTGKTTIAVQIAAHVATSRDLWGLPVAGGPVVGIFCEDEQDELERKVRCVAEHDEIDLASLDRLHVLSRDGEDNVLCTFERDRIVLTDFYRQLHATVSEYRPRLLIADTAADLFAGDFVSTPHVRQFIKVALGGLCRASGCGILLLAHPSSSAIASGDGGGFSTAWNNSVRSRLYLRRPKTDDPEAAADRRVLQVMKSNYGPTGLSLPLLWDAGRFVRDPEPIEEGTKPSRPARVDLGLGLAIMTFIRTHAAAGQVVRFGDVRDALARTGELRDGTPDAQKKRLSRSLDALVEEGMLRRSDVPRGYRIVRETP